MPESELLKLNNIKPAEFFKPGSGAVDALLAKVRQHTEAIVDEDPRTKEGRKAIVSRARQVSTLKAMVEKKGREELARVKATIKPLEAEVRKWAQGMDAIRDDTRRPVTEIEEAEKKLADAEAEAYEIEAQRRQEELARKEAEARQREEDLKRRERELALKEQAEKEAAERAKRAKAEAEAAAKRKAERAKQTADRKLAAEKAARERAEREAKLATERAARAAEEAAAEERRKAQKSEQERLAAEALAKRQEEMRLADQQHRAQIQTEAMYDLKKLLGCDASFVKVLVALVDQGKIRHMQIKY